ncbi:hypothetical protein M9458_017366, partial [Cirrhinus mrigala]
MANEEAACKIYAVLMEPEPEPEPVPLNRLMMNYHSLRRQVCFIQSVSVFFCFSCCVFTLLFHSFPPSCK